MVALKERPRLPGPTPQHLRQRLQLLLNPVHDSTQTLGIGRPQLRQRLSKHRRPGLDEVLPAALVQNPRDLGNHQHQTPQHGVTHQFPDGQGQRVAGVAVGEERGAGEDAIEQDGDGERVHHCAGRVGAHGGVRDGGQGVGEGTFRIRSHGETAQQRGDVGVGDEALGVWDAFVIEDQAGFGGVEGPGSQVVWSG